MISFKSVKDFAKVAALCAVFVSGWEGLWLTVKPDRLAHNIPTGGYGETENVKLGETHSKAYWQAMLAAKLPRYWSEIQPCIRVPISDNEMIAYTSFAYNVGSGGFCHSQAARKLNAGDHKGACNALMSWNHAGGREVRGLTNRRAAERKLCLTPDKDASEPYVCTPADAERGECVPLVETRSAAESTGSLKSDPGPKVAPAPTPPHESPKPSQPTVVCRGILFWKHCT